MKKELVDYLSKDVLKHAVEESYTVKSVSDSNSAGGAIFEGKLCSAINGLLKKKDGLFCLTQEILDNQVQRGEIDPVFPNNQKWHEFKKEIKEKTFHPYSAADLFLFKEDDDITSFIDAISLKASFSKTPSFTLHNDANGEIHEALENNLPFLNQRASIGKVLHVSLNVTNNEVVITYFDGFLDKLIPKQSYDKNKNGDIIYKIQKGKREVQGIFITNRNPPANDKRKQTSFNRGIHLVNRLMVEDLTKDGVLDKMLEFTIDCKAIRQNVENKVLAGEF